MQDTEAEKKEIKRRFQLWIRPSTLELADTLYKKDNCDSRSEFIEKAVIFYAGYLSAEDNKTYLPNIVTSTLKSIVAESDHLAEPNAFQAGCGAGGHDERGRSE